MRSLAIAASVGLSLLAQAGTPLQPSRSLSVAQQMTLFGEPLVVLNAEKVKFTGKKWQQKTYAAYSHYPGGLKVQTAEEVLGKHPERILEAAVRRMVPRNRLGRKQMDKLKVYAGPSHPHQAQQPKELKLDT